MMQNDDLYAAIGRTALRRVVVRDRLSFTSALHADTRGIDAFMLQTVCHGLRALL
jgi:hypothetical protein